MERELNPLKHYASLYESGERELAFSAGSKEAFDAWSEALRRRLTDLLGGFPAEKADLRLEVIESRTFDRYRRDKVVYQSDEEMAVPAYILYPLRGEGPYPGVVALHGHGNGKTDVLGLEPDGSPRRSQGDYHRSMGLRLAERGMVVIVPDQAGFGERRDEAAAAAGPKANSCRSLAFYAQMLGKTLLGLRVWDAMRAVDCLQSLPEVDPGRIGCIGGSGGGTTTLFTAALDPRVAAAVICSYLNTFKASILAVRHCECNYVPGILKYAEMPDVACAIAPRPLFVEGGTEDPIFPIEAARRAVEQVASAYALLGAGDRFAYDFFEGGHQINGRRAFDWLAEQLGAGYLA